MKIELATPVRSLWKTIKLNSQRNGKLKYYHRQYRKYLTLLDQMFKNECRSGRTEQNWKWSNKTFPHTLFVVSTSDETTHCGICLSSNKNLHWVSGREVWAQNCIFGGTIFSLKLRFVRWIVQKADWWESRMVAIDCIPLRFIVRYRAD